MFRNDLVAAEGMAAEVRAAMPDDKVKRLGNGPAIVLLAADAARMEVAVALKSREQAVGPFAATATNP